MLRSVALTLAAVLIARVHEPRVTTARRRETRTFTSS